MTQYPSINDLLLESIKQRIKQLKLKPFTVAVQAGVDPGFMYRMMNGKAKRVSCETIFRLMRELKYSSIQFDPLWINPEEKKPLAFSFKDQLIKYRKMDESANADKIQTT